MSSLEAMASELEISIKKRIPDIDYTDRVLLILVLKEIEREKDKSKSDGLSVSTPDVRGVAFAEVFEDPYVKTTGRDGEESATADFQKYDPAWLSSTNRVEVKDLKEHDLVGPLCDACYCTVLKSVK